MILEWCYLAPLAVEPGRAAPYVCLYALTRYGGWHWEDKDSAESWTRKLRTTHTSNRPQGVPVSIDDAPKAVQGERNVVTTISARSAQRI